MKKYSAIIVFILSISTAFADVDLAIERTHSMNSEFNLLTQGSISIKELSLDIQNLDWEKKSNPEQKGSLREVSYNFGLDENGGFIVENIYVGSSNSAQITMAHHKIKKWLGQFHSHPYKYESVRNNPFSTQDIFMAFEKVRHTDKGFIWLLGAGDYYFALEVLDPQKMTDFYKEQTIIAKSKGYQFVRDYLQKKYYGARGGSSVLETMSNSVMAIVQDEKVSGLRFLTIPR